MNQKDGYHKVGMNFWSHLEGKEEEGEEGTEGQTFSEHHCMTSTLAHASHILHDMMASLYNAVTKHRKTI